MVAMYLAMDVSWTLDGRPAGDGDLPREYHRLRRDYLQLSVRLGGLS